MNKDRRLTHIYDKFAEFSYNLGEVVNGSSMKGEFELTVAFSAHSNNPPNFSIIQFFADERLKSPSLNANN